MKVKVVSRTNGGWNINLIDVEIKKICPQCGGERGSPYAYSFHEDGVWYTCDRWDNPCGHIDKYADVLKESRLCAS